MTDLGTRFAQRTHTNPAKLGPCRCPGAPHPDGDEARVVQQFGQADAVRMSEAGWAAGSARGAFDVAASELAEVELGLVSWNLLDDAREPVPINATTIGSLDQITLAALIEALEPAMDRARAPAPNASGAPSATGSPGSASQTPETPTPVASSTS